jgi:hypothetical protein
MSCFLHNVLNTFSTIKVNLRLAAPQAENLGNSTFENLCFEIFHGKYGTGNVLFEDIEVHFELMRPRAVVGMSHNLKNMKSAHRCENDCATKRRKTKRRKTERRISKRRIEKRRIAKRRKLQKVELQNVESYKR